MTLYVVGIGPGGLDDMTIRAGKALEAADIIIGYKVYVDLVRDSFTNAHVISSPMKKEVDRCRQAYELARSGKTVAMVCSGDSGIYGMAALVYEVEQEFSPEKISIKIIPGVTAACSGAAVLGAPLTHDCALVSLSDLLTEWSQIEKRLECCALGDFAISLYNPRSKGRSEYLDKACEVLLRHKDPKTICGYVQNIGRDGERSVVCTLGDLVGNTEINMFTTVFIGSSQTQCIDGKMVTPRGYMQRGD